jgi:outer membrane protein TolC
MVRTGDRSTWLLALVAAGVSGWCATAAADERSIDLATALERAQEANEDWQIAEARLEQSRALRREALARLLPQLSASASATLNDSEVAFGERVVRQRIDWGTSAAASLALFDGAAYPLYQQADRLVGAREEEAAWTLATLRYEVSQAFFLLAAAQREVDIAASTVELRSAYVKQAEGLVASGVALQLDLLRAQALELEAEQAKLAARAELETRADVLAILLGESPDGSLRAVTDDQVPDPPKETEAEAGARADIEAQVLALEASRYAERGVWWSWLPRLALSARAQRGPPSFAAPDGFQWAATLDLTWSLYDGGARLARAGAAGYETDQVRLQLARAKRQALGDTRKALRDWRTAARAIEVAEARRSVADDAYRMTSSRFRSGLAMSVEVTEASDTLFRAAIDVSRARLQADLAAARFRYVAGQ